VSLNRLLDGSVYTEDVCLPSDISEHLRTPNTMNPLELLRTASFLPNSLRFPDAWIGHIPFAVWLIQQISPRIFVELGTHSGNSYFSFCQAVVEANLPTKCYAVDTWRGDKHAGKYGEEVFQEVNAHHQEYFAGFSRLLRMTFDDAVSYFEDRTIDLLHIDGLHSYAAVKHDFETWLPKLAPGAVVVFHDTNVRERGFGVWKLWGELQAQYPLNMEFVHSHGLGILQFSNNKSERQLPWLTSGTAEQQVLKNYFAALGARQIERYELINLRKTVAERNRQIATLNQVIVESDGQIANLNQAVAERDGQIANLNQAAAERDGQIANLNQAVAERDGQIASLNQAVAERDGRIANLNQAAAERDGRIANLNQAVAERDRQIANLNQAVAERDGQLSDRHKLAADREALRHTITELYASTSWRATRPVRYFGHRLRQIYAASCSAGYFLKTDGFRHSVSKTTQVLRCEGLRGIQNRLLLRTHPAQQRDPSSHQRSIINRTREGRYALAEHAGGYTYILPRRPDNIEQIIGAMKSPPHFSVVVPVYNTPADLLEKLLASVESQWYPHWELVLADDASSSSETRTALARISDARITIIRSDKNQGITGATNMALGRATGEFVVFLDHDDELTVDCLYELALCIERDDADFIYSDEDKISPQGDFVEPHFKPDWSPDTIMSTMFTCHVSCARRSLLEELGGLRPAYDGCQDWDLVLRLAEVTQRISHIPKVLYHWRIIRGSVAADLGAKSYVIDASKRVREDALRRRGLPGTVEAVSQVPGYFRVNYHLRGNPLISIVVPTRDNAQVLRKCVESIFECSTYRYIELIIIDNGSVDPLTVDYLNTLKANPNVVVIHHDMPFNFSELNNIGASQAKGELFLFLNNDTEVLTGDWLQRLGGYAQLPHIGAVGAKLLYPGGDLVQHAGILNLEDGPGHAFLGDPTHRPGYFMRNLLEYDWIAVTGACLMIERKKFISVGGFDETLPVAYNDIELCMRLHTSGYYNVVCQAVHLIHHESFSRGLDSSSPEKQDRLKRDYRRLCTIHPRYFQFDPFFNPNLSPNSVYFEIPV
jgi:O-antigen biosynthesis protein